MAEPQESWEETPEKPCFSVTLLQDRGRLHGTLVTPVNKGGKWCHAEEADLNCSLGGIRKNEKRV